MCFSSWIAWEPESTGSKTDSRGPCAPDRVRTGLARSAAGSSAPGLVFGSGFSVGGAPVPSGPLAATSGRLEGTLDSAETLSANFQQGQSGGSYTGTIELVPEPSLAWLQAVTLLSLAALRRCRPR